MSRKKNDQLKKIWMPLLGMIVLGAGLWFGPGFFRSLSQGENTSTSSQDLSASQPTGVQSSSLVEDRTIYATDKNDSLSNLYITVMKEDDPNAKGITFLDLHQTNSTTIESEDNDEKIKIIMQEGTAEGPSVGLFGYSTRTANGTIEIRGASSRRASQKSYKIRLFDSAGYWKDQRNINLNKHNDDITRVRQKLSFDYFKMIPNFSSLRTQFVQLYVKDLTGNQPNPQFIDYGLYTQIEQPNKTFLEAHGMDRNGHLYKANQFEFLRYPDKIKLSSDPGFDKSKFESVLETKGNDNHQKLITMLEDVNDPTKNINEVIRKHFDRDNYLTWMATNILMGNIDTNGHNFYLYSPTNSDKWYFLPWDYDLSWGYFEAEGKRSPSQKLANWQSSFAFYWGSVLHQRFLKNSDNVKELGEKIEEISKIITKEQTTALLKSYYPIARSFVNRTPDLYHLPYEIKHFESEYWQIPNEPEINKKEFYEHLEFPMPIYSDSPKMKGDQLVFTWDHSYDLQGDDLTYDFAISYDPAFHKIYYQAKNLRNTEVAVNKLPKGRYFYKLTIKDSKGHMQTQFDYYDEENARHHGVKEFTVQ